MKKLLSILMVALLIVFASCSNEPVISYTVTFESNGGTPVPSQKVEEGHQVIAPPTNPTKAGYVFVFWYLSGSTSAYDFQSSVNNDFTLYAEWATGSNGGGDNDDDYSPFAKLSEGLYRINEGSYTAIQVADSDPDKDTFVRDAVKWVNTNSEGVSTSIAEYVLVLDSKTYSTPGSVNVLTQKYTTLTIYGKKDAVIQLTSEGKMFDIGSYNDRLGVKFILDGHLTIQGISNNKASLLDVAFGATVEMKGNTKITNNSCDSENSALTFAAPGGVYVYEATLIMDDNAEISNVANRSNSYIIDRITQRMIVAGGGVAMAGGKSDSHTIVIMRGSSKITNNKVVNTAAHSATYGRGGGVVVGAYCDLIMEDNALIANNTAAGRISLGGGVYIGSGGTLTQKGSSKIESNTPDNIYRAE